VRNYSVITFSICNGIYTVFYLFSSRCLVIAANSRILSQCWPFLCDLKTDGIWNSFSRVTLLLLSAIISQYVNVWKSEIHTVDIVLRRFLSYLTEKIQIINQKNKILLLLRKWSLFVLRTIRSHKYSVRTTWLLILKYVKYTVTTVV
jgi:hypothetical protein